MIPIYEQGDGRGVGHSFDSFHRRFLQICEEHVESNRAHSFAFIFYDLDDGSLKSILRDQGVFTKLDRLVRSRLSLFYLHNPKPHTARSFNREFQDRLGISTSGPCVVFFRISSGAITDIKVCAIESTHLLQGFHEIHGIVSEYLEEGPTVKTSSKVWRSFGTGLKWVGKEAITDIVKEAIERGKVLDNLGNLLRLH